MEEDDLSPPEDDDDEEEEQEEERPRAQAVRGRGRGRGRGRRPRGRALAQGDRPVDLDHVFGWTDNDTEFQDMSLCDSTAEAHIDQNLTELEAFQLIFDDEFFRILKAETNRYARQTQNDAER